MPRLQPPASGAESAPPELACEIADLEIGRRLAERERDSLELREVRHRG